MWRRSEWVRLNVEEAVKSGKILPLVRIHSSSEKHKDAFVSIQYRDTYFWIDDRDLMSKKIFSFLMFLFTLMETGEKGTAPIVTVPTNSRMLKSTHLRIAITGSGSMTRT